MVRPLVEAGGEGEGSVLPGEAAVAGGGDADAGVAFAGKVGVGGGQRVIHVGDDHMVGIVRIDGYRRHLLHAGLGEDCPVDQVGSLATGDCFALRSSAVGQLVARTRVELVQAAASN